MGKNAFCISAGCSLLHSGIQTSVGFSWHATVSGSSRFIIVSPRKVFFLHLRSRPCWLLPVYQRNSIGQLCQNSLLLVTSRGPNSSDGIQKLAPGHTAVLEEGSNFGIRQYWDPPKQGTSESQPASYYVEGYRDLRSNRSRAI